MKQHAFPSPYGDYGSYHEYENNGYTEESCFRPLTGIMVLIFLVLQKHTTENVGIVSVPLRGLWFLSLDQRG